MSRELRINGGQVTLSSDSEITIIDVTVLAKKALEAGIPPRAKVNYMSVNYRPNGPNSIWEVVITWSMPDLEIDKRMTLD